MYASDFPPYKFASFSHFILLNPFHQHLSLSIFISVSLILGCSYFLAMDHHQHRCESQARDQLNKEPINKAKS